MKRLGLFFILGLLVFAENLQLVNPNVKFVVYVKDGNLEFETLSSSRNAYITTDGDFALDVVWTGWRAPGKFNNSENPVTFTKKDFKVEKIEKGKESDGTAFVKILMAGRRTVPLKLEILYSLGPRDFFVRRKIRIYDPKFGLHFLRRISVYRCKLLSPVKVIKAGGYGQPAAVRNDRAGAFWGLEYPAGTAVVKDDGVEVYQYIGEKITSRGIWSDPAVVGITPDPRVKYWFFRYLEKVQVAPFKPYLLYNSWYDLRSPELVKDPLRVMNEENTLRIINLFRKKLTEKYGIKLDAFVLDDGWDEYRSDWRLSRKQFPRGLKPVERALARTGTVLGIWFGPTGGYSHRDWRVSWMREHGYETVGDQMCFGGKNYYALFRKRVLDFVNQYGVAYYKWDGFQFSCSEPGHGHPVGIYSRRAILKKLAALTREVRRANPKMFLNITSGTWLSPWWLLYANTIWMQGYDYGYAKVPSISKRDRAMTYRDYVLYDDFVKKDFWFPVAGLMTHGIIKGHLQKLGGEAEPLDKFTNNAVLYFARGISMFELYVSPDLLTPQEWDAIARAYLWARSRFKILTHYTEMVGGNPGKGEAYGYVHFSGRRGIIALRNPAMKSQRIKVKLSNDYGLSPAARSLAVEEVYPRRGFFRKLYSYGDEVEFQLDGYETAIYEIYPVEEALLPAVGGAYYEVEGVGKDEVLLKLYATYKKPRPLNPELISGMWLEGRKVSRLSSKPLSWPRVKFRLKRDRERINLKLRIPSEVKGARLAVLLVSSGKGPLPAPVFYLDGKKVAVHQERNRDSSWAWYTLSLPPGEHDLSMEGNLNGVKKEGYLTLWRSVTPTVYRVKLNGVFKGRPLPPLPYPPGTFRKTLRIF